MNWKHKSSFVFQDDVQTGTVLMELGPTSFAIILMILFIIIIIIMMLMIIFRLERLYGMITDLYIDHNKFKGHNVKNKVGRFLSLPNIEREQISNQMFRFLNCWKSWTSMNSTPSLNSSAKITPHKRGPLSRVPIPFLMFPGSQDIILPR